MYFYSTKPTYSIIIADDHLPVDVPQTFHHVFQIRLPTIQDVCHPSDMRAQVGRAIMDGPERAGWSALADRVVKQTWKYTWQELFT